MTKLDEVRGKVQRILTDELNRVEIDRDGDFVVHHESVVAFVHIYPFNEEKADTDIMIRCWAPLVVDVPLTNEVYRWVATEGQSFHNGGCWLAENDDKKTGRIMFRIVIIGNDLDPNELKSAVYRTMFTSNDLDDKLKTMFGGRLFTE